MIKYNNPILISISGAHSGCGKTAFAERLLERLRGRWGAIKYTKTSFYSTIIDSPEIIRQRDKDTCRLYNAGAKNVLWVQSPSEGLKAVMDLAVQRLSTFDGIIVEGNSTIEFLDFDIIVFIYGKDRSRIKESGKNALQKATIVVNHDGFNKGIDMVMNEVKGKDIENRLIEASKDVRISCVMARRIAEELKVSYKEVGDAANRLKIKIKDCELGCF